MRVWGRAYPRIGLLDAGRELAAVGVFVLPQGARLDGVPFRRSLEQEAEVGRDERVRRRHGVGVVHGAVVTREGDPARVLTEAVLELGPDLARPLLELGRRVVDQRLALGTSLRLLLLQPQPV